MSAAEERVSAGSYPAPDVLAYLQNETELTRSTLVRILKESGRLGFLSLIFPEQGRISPEKRAWLRRSTWLVCGLLGQHPQRN